MRGGKKGIDIESGRQCMGVKKILMKANSRDGLVKCCSRVLRNGRIKKWSIWQRRKKTRTLALGVGKLKGCFYFVFLVKENFVWGLRA